MAAIANVYGWESVGLGRMNLKGQRKPAYLVRAFEAINEAWREYDAVVDMREDHRAVDAEVEHARLHAIKAEQHYHDLYVEWQNSFTHVSTVAQVEPELSLSK